MEAGGGGGSSSSSSKGLLERKARPLKDQALNCPRCNSTNTKFCYYNNYSLSQPRYFCKSCRRYWTEGGSLRNVPVGGGSRKNKRSSLSSSSTSSSSSAQDKKINGGSDQNPKIHHSQDLNLAIFPPSDQDYHHQTNANPPSSSASSHLSAMELLKSGMASRGLASFMAMPPAPPANGGGGSIFNSSGFALHELKPTLSFSLEGFENGYGDLHQGGQNHQTAATNGHLMFPIEELKQVSNSNATAEFEQSRGGGGGHGGDSAGYWNGMLGGGSW